MKEQLLKNLVAKYGAPLYVYDLENIKAQYERLKSAFAVPKIRLHFACKALSNINILRFLKSLGAGLDTVSIQEVHLGIKAGFEPQEIVYTPSGVSVQEVEKIAAMGVMMNLDSISVLEQFGTRFPDIPVGIRINPHIRAGGNDKISVGHVDSKFGISVAQSQEIYDIVRRTGMKIKGIHMHTGSDILDVSVFCTAAEVVFKMARKFKDLEFIDLGSGFKVPYKNTEKGTDIAALGRALSKNFNAFCKSYGRELKLMFEPGKFLVSAAGKFLTQVNVIKQTPTKTFAGVNSGFNHFARPMLYDAYHHITNISNPNGKRCVYDVVGYICEEDTFARDRQIAEISQGDILCFENAGAYCYTMASNYNSRLKPAEVLIYKQKDHLIQKRQTMEDIVRGQIDLNIF